jgi:hypothetical protein
MARPASDEEANIKGASFLRRVRAHALALSLNPIRLTQSLHPPGAFPSLIKTKNSAARAQLQTHNRRLQEVEAGPISSY